MSIFKWGLTAEGLVEQEEAGKAALAQWRETEAGDFGEEGGDAEGSPGAYQDDTSENFYGGTT